MTSQPKVLKGPVKLKRFAATYAGRCDKEKTKRRAEGLRRRIGTLQELLYANSKQAVLLLFQGVDATREGWGDPQHAAGSQSGGS